MDKFHEKTPLAEQRTVKYSKHTILRNPRVEVLTRLQHNFLIKILQFHEPNPAEAISLWEKTIGDLIRATYLRVKGIPQFISDTENMAQHLTAKFGKTDVANAESPVGQYLLTLLQALTNDPTVLAALYYYINQEALIVAADVDVRGILSGQNYCGPKIIAKEAELRKLANNAVRFKIVCKVMELRDVLDTDRKIKYVVAGRDVPLLYTTVELTLAPGQKVAIVKDLVIHYEIKHPFVYQILPEIPVEYITSESCERTASDAQNAKKFFLGCAGKIITSMSEYTPSRQKSPTEYLKEGSIGNIPYALFQNPDTSAKKIHYVDELINELWKLMEDDFTDYDDAMAKLEASILKCQRLNYCVQTGKNPDTEAVKREVEKLTTFTLNNTVTKKLNEEQQFIIQIHANLISGSMELEERTLASVSEHIIKNRNAPAKPVV